ncbi:hypothetical protein [Erythrobacter sp.]|uniref:hypothetical protein n=1 Tax=Erythrobacter sp. TaxID=1042 RepID=UPI003C73D7FA
MKTPYRASRLALVAGAGLCTMLAACGGDDSSPPIATPAPTPAPPVVTKPGFTSTTSVNVTENTLDAFYTAQASDPQGDPVTITLHSGPDADKLVMDGSGNLRFNQNPNFDLPSDANRDNFYEVVLRASAGGETTDMLLVVKVENDREGVIVKRVATGFVDPVAIAQIMGEPTLLIAERGGRVLRFDQEVNSITEDIFIRDNRRPGEILAIGYATPDGSRAEGIYMVTHSPTEGLLLQGFDERRGAFVARKLAEPWSEPTTASFTYQPEVLVAIGSPTEAEAQDASSAYGKLIKVKGYNLYSGASVPPSSRFIFSTEIIGDGIRRPGGFSLADDFSYLADRGREYNELSVLHPEWRPLDFGWPFYDGTQATRANPPAAILGPTLIYEVGDGRKQGDGIIAGQRFRASSSPAFGNAYVFFDKNGTVFSIPLATFEDGFNHSAVEFEDRTQDFVPDTGTIGRLVGYGAGVATTFFYLLDEDGQLFEVTQEGT